MAVDPDGSKACYWTWYDPLPATDAVVCQKAHTERLAPQHATWLVWLAGSWHVDSSSLYHALDSPIACSDQASINVVACHVGSQISALYLLLLSPLKCIL